MLSQNTQFGLIWPLEMLKVTPFFGFFDDSEHNLCGENKNIAAFLRGAGIFSPGQPSFKQRPRHLKAVFCANFSENLYLHKFC